MMDMTIRIKGRDLDVNFHVEDITLAKSGIGWYEFWGARCYDAGLTYVDDFTVTAVTVYSERRSTWKGRGWNSIPFASGTLGEVDS